MYEYEVSAAPYGLTVLNVLASAIAGSSLAVVETDGKFPILDGATIRLCRNASNDDRIASVAFLAALIGGGGVCQTILRAIRARPTALRRWLLVEGSRAVAALGPIVPRGPAERILKLGAPPARDPEEALAIALGSSVLPNLPPTLGSISLRWIREGSSAQSDNLKTTIKCAELPDTQDEEDDQRSSSQFMQLMSIIASVTVITRFLRNLFGTRRSADKHSTSTGHVGGNGERRGMASLSMPITIRRPAAISRIDAEGSVSAAWPEWDERLRRYRPRWCTVMVFPAEEREPVLRSDPTLQRVLSRLAQELRRVRRQKEGIDLDYDAVIRAAIDRHTGITPDDRLAVDLLRKDRCLALLVLLDISASALETAYDGRTVHENQLEAAAAILDTAGKLGDSCALYAFQSRGRHQVHLRTVKQLDQPAGLVPARRLGGLRPGAFTRLGAALRHAGWLIREQSGSRHQLVVVISDGFAFDDGYEGSYAQADAARAVQELRESGVGVICLSPGRDGSDELLVRTFGHDQHLAAQTWVAIREKIGRLFHLALSRAEEANAVSRNSKTPRTGERHC